MATKTKPPKTASRAEINEQTNGRSAEVEEVLTLGEAARYLRVADSEVLRLAESQKLPGRRIGDEWRFLKSGLQDWLRSWDVPAGKEAMLALVGVWKDDPDIEGIICEAHRRRRRRATEGE